MTESAPQRAFVGLGANLGDPQAALSDALERIARLPGTRLVAQSRRYRSAPVEADGPDFFNAVAELQTTLEPLELLRELQAIEHHHGRQRPFVNAPRTLDLDLLLYADRVLASDELTLPHPRMHRRAFVLLPLAELDPVIVAPGLGLLADWARRCSDQRIEVLPT